MQLTLKNLVVFVFLGAVLMLFCWHLASNLYVENLEVDVRHVSASGAVSHANSRHGSEADLARTCSDSSSNPIRFFNPETKRSAWVCDLGGFFGVHIKEIDGEEVTAFIKNKMKRVDQVLKYMKNAGYELVH